MCLTARHPRGRIARARGSAPRGSSRTSGSDADAWAVQKAEVGLEEHADGSVTRDENAATTPDASSARKRACDISSDNTGAVLGVKKSHDVTGGVAGRFHGLCASSTKRRDVFITNHHESTGGAAVWGLVDTYAYVDHERLTWSETEETRRPPSRGSNPLASVVVFVRAYSTRAARGDPWVRPRCPGVSRYMYILSYFKTRPSSRGSNDATTAGTTAGDGPIRSDRSRPASHRSLFSTPPPRPSALRSASVCTYAIPQGVF